MSGSVICHGCGQALPIPADYERRKMRCPQCGVICELSDPDRGQPPAPKPGRRPAPAPDPEAAAEEVLLQPEEPRRCPRCGEALEVGGPRGRLQCPRCAPSTGIKAASERIAVPPSQAPAAPEPTTSQPSVFDDTDGYGVVGGVDEAKCPGCGQPLKADAVACPSCGFNRQTGKKPPKVYETLERHWDAGLALRTRIVVLIASQAVIVPLGYLGALYAEEVPVFAITWLLATVMLAFLLGTYDRLDMARNKKGRVQLTKTWRVCFVPQTTTTIRLSEYEGLVSSQTREVGFWDWLIVFVVLPAGLVPSLIWWWYAIYHDSFQVALARDHGYPDVILYRGWSEAHMRDIARALQEATGMPWEGG